MYRFSPPFPPSTTSAGYRIFSHCEVAFMIQSNFDFCSDAELK